MAAANHCRNFKENDMVKVTAEALLQIQNAASQAGADGMALRIAAKRDFDGSIQYGMGFDEQADGDLLIESDGLKVLVASPSQPLLSGAVLDFVEMSPGNFQFIFINPHDTAGSSCGSSGNGGSAGGGGCGGCGGGCH
ncbi:MAG: iron-sulfur cluster assembly accessory protein [Sulfurimicrobium sp.]|jgi:iron-sulfur cluster assembly protein|nr:iron-sulfur cluster assembly accessory protein [Sulfurimicrobium sp.]MDZ7656685.1 iron-sulfur cluster assembly accessory protein [Sulfurimicrobium sp.]